MSRMFTRKKDLTVTKGNPAHAIRQRYDELMAIQDPSVLALEAKKIVTPFVNNGMGENNWLRFSATIDKLDGNLAKLQSYLTNFLLAASGNSVIGAY